jgi:hypothetical protein
MAIMTEHRRLREPTAMTRQLLFLLLAAALFAPIAVADDQILMPVLIGSDPIPGAHGSLWTTRVWVTNVGADPVQIGTYCNTVCPPAVIAPGASMFEPNIFPTSLPTNFLTAISGDIGNLRVSLRALDLSRQATSAGTEIPTVRTTQLRTDTVHLVGIPVDSRFRFTLRVYAMQATTVIIRARSMDKPAAPLLFETSAVVDKRYGDAPGYLQLDDFLAGNPALAGVFYFRVEVSPVSPVPLWSFLTITNNDTEQLTTITPN